MPCRLLIGSGTSNPRVSKYFQLPNKAMTIILPSHWSRDHEALLAQSLCPYLVLYVAPLSHMTIACMLIGGGTRCSHIFKLCFSIFFMYQAVPFEHSYQSLPHHGPHTTAMARWPPLDYLFCLRPTISANP